MALIYFLHPIDLRRSMRQYRLLRCMRCMGEDQKEYEYPVSEHAGEEDYKVKIINPVYT